MKLRPIFSALTAASCHLAEASIIPQSFEEIRARLEPRLFRGYRKPKADDFPKYFHEPGGGDVSNHYDSRYEHGIQSYSDKQDTQIHMMRAYLGFFQEKGLETWLAHGTLLGWWWNAKMLPWDWDIDTQVSGPTLMFLGEHYNGTIYDYTSTDTDPDIQPPIERQYLLDINPAILARERGNGENVIDARWIDMRNGLYIDVTGVSETNPMDMPGVWSCKNYHRYKTTDLYPMRQSVYEGVVAKVPYAYDRILAEEYQEKALVVTEYEGHRWHPITKEWIKKTPDEIKKERLDRQAARRKKQEEKAQKKKDKDQAARMKEWDKEKARKANAKLESNYDFDEDSTGPDHGIPEPEKEPGTAKRAAISEPEAGPEAGLEAEPDALPNLETETSGLAHLRRRRRQRQEVA